MENMAGQCLLYIMLLALLAWPLGIYMGKVMDGEPLWLQKILAPCERTIYRVMGVNPAEKNELEALPLLRTALQPCEHCGPYAAAYGAAQFAAEPAGHS